MRDRLFQPFASFFAIFMAVAAPNSTALAAQTRQPTRHVADVVANLKPTGRLPGATKLNLAIGLPLRNQLALSNLLQALYDPASPQYHHYLSPEQFTEDFGPTTE